MFTEALSGSRLNRLSDEDLCSQLNYIWSSTIIAVMGVLITMVQYVGDPIHCWCPAQLPDAQCNYTKALCWVKHNYYVHEDAAIAVKEEDRYDVTIAYYPWVPWILFLIAAMFQVPHIIWDACLPQSGLNLNKFITLADKHQNLEELGKILRLWLVKTNTAQKSVCSSIKRQLGNLGLFWFGKHHRTYLSGLTLATKLNYLLVSVALFFGVNIFIDQDFRTYGFDVIEHFLRGIPLNAERFPKYSMCDIKIRQMANVQTYSMQCILPINMYNEKIFIFLWFWLIIIIGFNAYSFMRWALHILSPGNRRKFVKEYVIILYHLLVQKQKKEKLKNNGESNPPDNTDPDRGGAMPSLEDIEKMGTDKPRERRKPTSRSTTSEINDAGFLTRRQSKPSSIETCEYDEMNQRQKKHIKIITARMMKHFGPDGIVLFRTLEHAVGIVISNQIFQEVYEQFKAEHHYS